MKKLLKIIAVLTVVMTLSSCSAFVHPIDSLKLKVAAERNFQLDIKIAGIPLVGDVSVLYRQDGDKTYTSGILGTESYTEKVDGETYEYKKNLLGKWNREKSDGKGFSEYIDEETVMTLLTADNYTKSETEDDTYILKSEVTVKNLKNVRITFGEDTYKFDFTYDYNGFETNGTMTMSKIGDVTVELPTVS